MKICTYLYSSESCIPGHIGLDSVFVGHSVS